MIGRHKALTCITYKFCQRMMKVVAHSKKPDVRHRHQTDRTTRMLVIILLLFLVTEIPQGIMALLSGIWGHQFFTHCYSGMGEILDLVALLNSAVNFLLLVFHSNTLTCIR